MKAQEYRNHSLEELQALHREERKKLFDQVNAARVSKQREKPHEMRAQKKKIARLLTVLNEKKRAS